MASNNNNRNANDMNKNNAFLPKNSINAMNNYHMNKSVMMPSHQMKISQNSQNMNQVFSMRNNNNQIYNNNNFNNNQLLYHPMNSDQSLNSRFINGVNNNNYIQYLNDQNVNNQYRQQNNSNNQFINNQNQNFQDYSLRKGTGMIANDEVSDFIVKLCKKSIDQIIEKKK
jgi:hypothetical protein